MTRHRYDHSSWASPLGVVLVGGGDEATRATTELLRDTGQEAAPGFSLDQDVLWVVKIHSDSSRNL